LFESAAYVYGPDLIGVILTGNNYDGSHGLKEIKRNCGLTIVQTPESAEADAMPRAAIEAAIPPYILSLEEIGLFIAAV
jgi:two-component system chemotaxis response regulator CheB